MYQCLLACVLLVCLSTSIETIKSLVMLSSSISVCAGDQLSFRCTTNNNSIFLSWNVTIFLPGRPHSISKFWLVTAVTQDITQLTISGHPFSVTRNSAFDSFPLVTTLTFPNVTADLNGTTVRCTNFPSNIFTGISSAAATIFSQTCITEVQCSGIDISMSDSVMPCNESNDVNRSSMITKTMSEAPLTWQGAGSIARGEELVPAVVLSATVVCVFSSLLLFIIGFLSGYFTIRFRIQYTRTNSTTGTYEQPQPNGQTQDQPLYETIPELEQQNFELEENAAYSTSAANLNDQQELQMAENLAYTPVQLGDED